MWWWPQCQWQQHYLSDQVKGSRVLSVRRSRYREWGEMRSSAVFCLVFISNISVLSSLQLGQSSREGPVIRSSVSSPATYNIITLNIRPANDGPHEGLYSQRRPLHRAFSWLKAPTSTFTFKTLRLREPSFEALEHCHPSKCDKFWLTVSILSVDSLKRATRHLSWVKRMRRDYLNTSRYSLVLTSSFSQN